MYFKTYLLGNTGCKKKEGKKKKSLLLFPVSSWKNKTSLNYNMFGLNIKSATSTLTTKHYARTSPMREFSTEVGRGYQDHISK